MNKMGRPVFGWICTVVLSAYFLYAAVPKIMNPGLFATQIAAYQLLHETGVFVVAWLLPWLEVWAVVAIFVPPLRRGGQLWIVAMLVVFTIAKASAMARGLEISCGCTAQDKGPITGLDLAFNGVWLILSWVSITLLPYRNAAGVSAT